MESGAHGRVILLKIRSPIPSVLKPCFLICSLENMSADTRTEAYCNSALFVWDLNPAAFVLVSSVLLSVSGGCRGSLSGCMAGSGEHQPLR